MSETYRAIQLPAYNTNIIKAMLGMSLTGKVKPVPGPSQLLIRMEAVQFNPSDIAFLQGGYNIIKSLPCVPGFEGCGVVEAAGSELNPADWLGNRVVCFTQQDKDGTWAGYFVADLHEVLPASGGLEPEQLAGSFVNPLTAWGLVSIALQRQSSCVAINAAGSQVAAWVVALCKHHGIKTIGITRKAETIQKLSETGYDGLVSTATEGWEGRFRELAHEYGCTTAFDAVGGELSGLMLNLMPADQELVVYGGLSGRAVSGVDFMQLIFRNAMITGFNLNDWILLSRPGELQEAYETISRMLAEQDIEPKIQSVVSPEEFVKGMRTYLSDMSAGKVIIRF
jgi:NADPH:quinone reductase-like Zn-dependent oxidoreductase